MLENREVETVYSTLREAIIEHIPTGDLLLVDEAYEFSRKAHRGQVRVSGEDFVNHPVEVALILAELEIDIVTIIAALLHDVVEDTDVTLGDIETEFGPEIAKLVDGVTKLSKLEGRSREEEQAENLRKMFLAMAQDIRVVLIKLADRLHNMRTLEHLSPESRRRIAQETLDVFAPLAHRLGIFRIKWELEDLALRYLEPEKYSELVELVAKERDEREAYIRRVGLILEKRLKEAGIEAEIFGRPKNYYSIYRKMYEQGRSFEDIYDLLALRVIVNTVKDCYGALGIVHTLWKPIPGRFKDFIAMPKSNMYQSLHTTVVGPDGEFFEIQIRTWEMHRTAEYGIAAHWKYKEGGRTDKEFDEKLSWLRQILDWQNELKDAREFMESLKIDLFENEVFVFTPKGDVIDLPAGATPIDFAYAIHTDVGHRCIGAKVNGRIIPLDYKLRNGDMVEILTSKGAAGPSWDWLALAKTSTARNKIRQWFKKERKEEFIEKGRESLEREIVRQGWDVKQLWREKWLLEIAEKLNGQEVDDLLLAIGFGAASAIQVAHKLIDFYRRETSSLEEQVELPVVRTKVEKGKSSGGVRVEGIDNALVRFSRCCNPIPGDRVIGYVTRGRGVSIHRTDCPNMSQYMQEKERLIEVAWENLDASYYPVEIAVSAVDRPGLLSDVAKVVADTKTNILSAKARADKHGGYATIDLILEIRNLKELEQITRRISGISDVTGVERVIRDNGRADASQSRRAGDAG